jgi:hypothetical protein
LRKIAAILLLCLLSFNWFGYKFVTNYLQKKADHQLEARIDMRDYDESQLVEIRIALNMPYQNNSAGFERQYGEVELNGKTYAYVKRKVEDGYLVLKCIPNEIKQKIKSADNALFTANNGLDQEHGTKNNSPLPQVLKSIFTDYDDQSGQYVFAQLVISDQSFSIPASTSLSAVDLPVAEQPPETLIG